jgi:hypothetical protein
VGAETLPGSRRAAAVVVEAEARPRARGLAASIAVEVEVPQVARPPGGAAATVGEAETQTGTPRGGATAGAVKAEKLPRTRGRGRATAIVVETGVPPGTQEGGAVTVAAEALRGARRAGPATVDVVSEAPEFTRPPGGAAAVVAGRGGAATEAVETEGRPLRRRRYCSRPVTSLCVSPAFPSLFWFLRKLWLQFFVSYFICNFR